MRTSANTISTEHVGAQTIKANRDRSYFFIVMLDTAGTISFGGGTGEIPLGIGEHYVPYICPTGEIAITTTGSYVIHMG